MKTTKCSNILKKTEKFKQYTCILILWRLWGTVFEMEMQQYFACIVALIATVDSTKILSVVQKCLYGKFMSPSRIKVFRSLGKVLDIFVLFSLKLEFLNHLSHIKFYWNPSSENHIGTCGQVDKEANISKLIDAFRIM